MNGVGRCTLLELYLFYGYTCHLLNDKYVGTYNFLAVA